jgi:hypothetical protein
MPKSYGKSVTIESDKLDYPVEIIQLVGGEFIVNYGEDQTRTINYHDAALALGSALMHSMVCKGSLNP